MLFFTGKDMVPVSFTGKH